MAERSVVHATFSIQRAYDSPPAKVFNAFADPAVKRRWFAEGEGCQVDEYSVDFNVGGYERTRFRFGDGAPMRNDTTYHDIVPNERIIFSYTMTIGENRISSSLATIEFNKAGAGTELRLTEQGAFLDGLDTVGPREAGWKDLLETLARALQS
ncbi:MAG: SRPBCC family protein [Dongiaceae bacterium]